MHNYQKQFKLRNLCKAMQVSKSGFYAYLTRKAQTKSDLIADKVKKIFEENKCRYGAPRIHAQMLQQGHKIGQRTIARRMKKLNLCAKAHKKAYRAPANKSNKIENQNLLERNFKADLPNQKWVSDMTYLPTNQGWAYLCVVMDLFSRKIIAWKLGMTMETSLVIDTLNDAFLLRKTQNVLFHSDQGSQYKSAQVVDFLLQNNARQSFSRVGNCLDNAVAESFFKTLKTELPEPQSLAWTFNQLNQELFEYIDLFYNNIRMHSYLQYLCPNDFEKIAIYAYN